MQPVTYLVRMYDCGVLCRRTTTSTRQIQLTGDKQGRLAENFSNQPPKFGFCRVIQGNSAHVTV